MNIVDQVPEHIRTLVPYAPGKPIEEVEREYGIANSVKLASNENPLGPSSKAVSTIKERLDQLHLYPDGDCFYLKTGVAKKLGVVPEQLIFGNGSNEIIELAVRTFMRPGDEAVMAQQAFVVYQLVVQAVGGISRAVPLRDFVHDLDAIARAITQRRASFFWPIRITQRARFIAGRRGNVFCRNYRPRFSPSSMKLTLSTSRTRIIRTRCAIIKAARRFYLSGHFPNCTDLPA